MLRFPRKLAIAVPLAVIALLMVFAVANASAKRALRSSAAPAGSASVKLSSCVSGANYADRKLEFRGTMQSIDAGGKLQMRFILYRYYTPARSSKRSRGKRTRKHFRRVPATDANKLNQWVESSDLAATKYIHTLAIMPVETRAQYRAKVQFRWLDASRKIVARATRVSRTCTQRRSLPDLVVSDFDTYPNPGKTAPAMPNMYVVTVKNLGRSSAFLVDAPFVSAEIDGTPMIEGDAMLPTGFDTLPGRSLLTRVFYGPACSPGQVIRFKADPKRRVRETKRSNNELSVNC